MQEIVANLEATSVVLTVPRFSFRTAIPLKSLLQGMGMAAPFAPGSADFSGIDVSQELYISNVLHDAFIEVDEEGTEAAAATAVVMAVTSQATEDVTLPVDRPFLLLIRDRQSDSILFLGRVMNPQDR